MPSEEEDSEEEALPKRMPWKRYFEPAIVVPLMHNEKTRFWLFGINIVIYYLLQVAACIAITNLYGD